MRAAEIRLSQRRSSTNAARETTERRQALALYELARHALFTGRPRRDLQSIAMVLSSALDHDRGAYLASPSRSVRSVATPHIPR